MIVLNEWPLSGHPEHPGVGRWSVGRALTIGTRQGR
jgi:hypothetical protein